MYLNPDEYTGSIPPDEQEQRLADAQMVVDSLTYNRIVRRGFENLTAFQQRLVKESVRKQANFAYENAEMLDSPLSSYSINGVSMGFDKSKVMEINNITTTREVYGLLIQTGLCYGGIK